MYFKLKEKDIKKHVDWVKYKRGVVGFGSFVAPIFSRADSVYMIKESCNSKEVRFKWYISSHSLGV